MLADYKVGRCSRRCYAENRPLNPGEVFYSVVISSESGDLERRDYSARAWTEPPEGTLGWWKGRIPEAGKQKLVLAPNPVLVELLRQLAENEERSELAYLLALLLMRRRVVRPLARVEDQDPSQSAAENGSVDENGPVDESTAALKYLTLEVIADGQSIEVLECEIQPQDAARLRDELNELLYCEAE